MITEALGRSFSSIPRKQLGFFPTPLHPAPRLTARLGAPRILVKRDDLSGLALGGNKVRKLEFLVGEALARGCDTLITGGAAQSNHSRQTAAAAAASGLACHLVLGGTPPVAPQGNLLIDQLCGAQLHFTGERRKGEDIPEIAAQLEARGAKPYLVPYGGSNAVGALGFVRAAQELAEQLTLEDTRVSHLIFASSSGATHAGLALGLKWLGVDTKAVGIAIDKEQGTPPEFARHVASLANASAELLQLSTRLSPDEILLRNDFLAGGYGVVGQLERRAMATLAQTEGILLDPVYTARAMGALMSLIERGELGADHTVVFWHTGGQPALFVQDAGIL